MSEVLNDAQLEELERYASTKGLLDFQPILDLITTVRHWQEQSRLFEQEKYETAARLVDMQARAETAEVRAGAWESEARRFDRERNDERNRRLDLEDELSGLLSIRQERDALKAGAQTLEGFLDESLTELHKVLKVEHGWKDDCAHLICLRAADFLKKFHATGPKEEHNRVRPERR